MKVRTAHVEALGSRAQLEGFLSDCLNDVEKQIARHQIESADAVMSTSTGRAHVLEERDRVLELLLSQKRVIALLIGQRQQKKYLKSTLDFALNTWNVFALVRVCVVSLVLNSALVPKVPQTLLCAHGMCLL